jgi:hypothetical protein
MPGPAEVGQMGAASCITLTLFLEGPAQRQRKPRFRNSTAVDRSHQGVFIHSE